MKIIGFILILSFFNITYANAALVAYWTGDGTFIDATGNGHDGTGFGNTSFVSGVFGQAFSFDGSGDYINVAHSNAFDFGTGDFSITFRVNFNTIVSDGNGMIDKDNFNDPSTTSYSGWHFNTYASGGGVGIGTRDTPTVSTHSRYETDNFTTNTWYNITSTRENNILNLYVDGVLRNSVEEIINTDVNNQIDLIIGALRPQDPYAQFFNGSIDDIAIYNNALSNVEVVSINNNGVSLVPVPAAVWLFASSLIGFIRIRKKSSIVSELSA